MMATVTCPGCGLPRGETETGAPCPVCASAPAPAAAPRTRPPAAPNPTAGLPADVSELHAPPTPRPRAAGSGSWLVGPVAFAAGALCGVGGLLGYQALDRPRAPAEEPAVAQNKTDPPPAVRPAPVPAPVAIAPMPHEPVAELPSFGPEPELEVDVVVVPLRPPGQLTTHEFNRSNGVYSVPPLKSGEHVVLTGKVRSLRVHGLDAGAVLDASRLEAAVVVVTGKVDGRSTLKLNAPNGAVNVSAKVDGQSVVLIDAPGGDVKFVAPTTATREGSKIDRGSAVTITARAVEFKGEITGTATKVFVNLTRNGLLRVTSVTGTAVVEYKSLVAGWAVLDVSVGTVANSATVRKVE